MMVANIYVHVASVSKVSSHGTKSNQVEENK